MELPESRERGGGSDSTHTGRGFASGLYDRRSVHKQSRHVPFPLSAEHGRNRHGSSTGSIHLYVGGVQRDVTTVAPPGDGLCVRPVERADLLAVHRIEQSAFPQPWPFRAFEQYLEEPGFLVAEDGGVVGYVIADSVPNHGRPLGHIKDIAVRENRRGEGIGALLVERALGVLGTRGVASVKLEVRESNARARSLYRQYGFVHRRTVPRYYSDGEDALVLVRDQ